MSRVARTALWVRVLVFVIILGVSAGTAVVSAAQADFGEGAGLGLLGGMLIGGTLVYVAVRRRAWVLDGRNQLMGALFAGVIGVAAAGPGAISHLVLAVRGELVDVTVWAAGEADEDGYRYYDLVPENSEAESIDSLLRTQQEFEYLQTVPVLVDPGGFVRPALPAEVDPVLHVGIVLFGVLCLAVVVIGVGFPITDRYSGVEGEDSETGAAR